MVGGVVPQHFVQSFPWGRRFQAVTIWAGALTRRCGLRHVKCRSAASKCVTTVARSPAQPQRVGVITLAR